MLQEEFGSPVFAAMFGLLVRREEHETKDSRFCFSRASSTAYTFVHCCRPLNFLSLGHNDRSLLAMMQKSDEIC
jgi:hypothetical protein